ncbi:MAG: FAD-dependent oxidoreductase [Clostridia bacterium]|nr:FAD-dependent oxidoreductase [Clostridia bacterium]
MQKYDLIVVGGGISGVAAATTAAREGLSVLLIEKFGSLGGAMSNSLVYPFMKHYLRLNGEKQFLSASIFSEMKERREKYNDISWETYKFVFDDMVTEAGVDVIFHSDVFETVTDGRMIRSVKVATKAGVLEFEADFFIDASGDGELFAMAGCDFQLGRESDGYCQPMTTCFRVAGVDVERFKEEKAALQEKYNALQAENKITNPRENILVFIGPGEGILHFNTTRIVKHDPTDPFEISRAEIIARKQINEMMIFLKENSAAFEHSSLVYIANHIGVRESRKLKGEHILTVDELKSCVKFEDSIACGNYDIDIHNPLGTGTYIYRFKDGEYYTIPYRSLLPREYDNMLVAGRCLSADHGAHSSVRIMPICACLGEAAGVAISVAKRSGTNAHTVDVSEVRSKLREKGAVID